MRHIWLFWAPVVLSGAFCLPAPAQARPRDEALSGAIRCGVVADSRQWLDCYYGAVQPMRAALGLVSALPAQIALAASPPPGSQQSDQTVRDEVVSAAAACMRLTDDRPWLDCYYAAAMPMRVQLGLSSTQTAARSAPAPQLALVSNPPARAAAPPGLPPMPRNVSMFRGLLSDLKPIVSDMPMQSFVLAKNGAFTVTLADGEVWKQSDEDEIYHPAHWRKEASQMRVTIAPDAMHTFIMTVADEGRVYKVHRIR